MALQFNVKVTNVFWLVWHIYRKSKGFKERTRNSAGSVSCFSRSVCFFICYCRCSMLLMLNASHFLDVEMCTRRPFSPQQFTATQRTRQSHLLLSQLNAGVACVHVCSCVNYQPRANASGETGLHGHQIVAPPLFY